MSHINKVVLGPLQKKEEEKKNSVATESSRLFQCLKL